MIRRAGCPTPSVPCECSQLTLARNGRTFLSVLPLSFFLFPATLSLPLSLFSFSLSLFLYSLPLSRPTLSPSLCSITIRLAMAKLFGIPIISSSHHHCCCNHTWRLCSLAQRRTLVGTYMAVSTIALRQRTTENSKKTNGSTFEIKDPFPVRRGRYWRVCEVTALALSFGS